MAFIRSRNRTTCSSFIFCGDEGAWSVPHPGEGVVTQQDGLAGRWYCGFPYIPERAYTRVSPSRASTTSSVPPNAGHRIGGLHPEALIPEEFMKFSIELPFPPVSGRCFSRLFCPDRLTAFSPMRMRFSRLSRISILPDAPVFQARAGGEPLPRLKGGPLPVLYLIKTFAFGIRYKGAFLDHKWCLQKEKFFFPEHHHR